MSDPKQARNNGSHANWIFAGFVLLVGILLFIDHRAHVLGVLPYLLLLACPLMHLLMHRGHGGHRGGHANDARIRNEDQPTVHG